MPQVPYDLINCSWPRPVIRDGERWVSEPEWSALAMPATPVPHWTLIDGTLCWTLDWRQIFRSGVELSLPESSGEMCGFHVVFSLRIRQSGRLFFWDDDGCIIRRAGHEIHIDRTAHRLTQHDIDVKEGDILEIAHWQHVGVWMWAGSIAGENSRERTPAEVFVPYLAEVEVRLRRPEGPPLKIYTHGRSPVCTVLSIYSMILNGYAPSTVLLYGDYQWSLQTLQMWKELLPFCKIVPTEEVLGRILEAGGTRLQDWARKHWFVMKTCVSLLSPPSEFCLMDDDVVILDSLQDALEGLDRNDLIYAPDTDHGATYSRVWSRMQRGTGEITTGRFNAGLYWMRNTFERASIARYTTRVLPNPQVPWVWEQGLIATMFSQRRTLELSRQRYFYPLFDGLPGGTIGYDYLRNPCGFASIHYGGLREKPADAVALLLADEILGNG